MLISCVLTRTSQFPFILRDYVLFVATAEVIQKLWDIISWEGTIALEPGRKQPPSDTCSIRKMIFIKHWFAPLWKAEQITNRKIFLISDHIYYKPCMVFNTAIIFPSKNPIIFQDQNK